jgi:hypothetical protein
MFIGLKKNWVVLAAFCLWGLVALRPQPLGSEEPSVTPPTTIAPEKQGEMEKIKLTEIQEGVTMPITSKTKTRSISPMSGLRSSAKTTTKPRTISSSPAIRDLSAFNPGT